MTQVAGQSSKPAPFEGIPIVDADTHISEWDDLWTSRASAKYRDRVPQKRNVDGKKIWHIDGDRSMGTSTATSAVRDDGSKSEAYQFLDWSIDDVHPASYNVGARVQFMNETGIAAQIAYPNLLGFGGQRAFMVDPDLRLVSSQIYNDAMAELQETSGNRIFPMALLPWWDVDQAVAEVRRCAAMGMRGVNLSSDPQRHGLPHLGDAHWNPLWEACLEADLPVNFHIGASEDSMTFAFAGHWADENAASRLAFSSVMLIVGNLRVLTNIFLSGWLERFPTLRLVSVESGIGWLPFVFEAVEYEMNETGMKYEHSPREIFERQIYACSWFERRNYADKVRNIGINNVMFETDFPHPTCLYPDALTYMAQAAESLEREERRKVFGGNAARVYNLPIAADQ